MWRASDATRRRWENKARTRGAEQCWHLMTEQDGYSDGLCRVRAPHASAHCTSLGSPFFVIITIPISKYRVIGMMMTGFVGVSLKRQLRNATLAPSCSYYASCAAARGAAVDALGSQPVVVTCRIPGTPGFLSIVVGVCRRAPLCR
jgi:hypothetical protein